MMDKDDARLVRIPLAEAQVPTKGVYFQHYRDYWWVCDDDNLICFRGGKNDSLSPQCNQHETMVRNFVAKTYPWAQARLVNSAFIPIRISDYV